MSPDDQIAALEALLARVRSRSRSPSLQAPPARASSHDVAAAPSGRIPSPLPVQPPIRPKYTARPELPPGLFATSQPEVFPRSADPWAPTLPKNGTHTEGAKPALPEPPPMEVVELEVDPEPSPSPPPDDSWTIESQAPPPIPEPVAAPAPVPLESRSRLVAAPPVSLDQFEPLEPPDQGDFEDVGSEPRLQVAPVAAASVTDDAAEDAAPSSSRRPISLEAKMTETEDDMPPLYSPPPKSGPLPAALPSFDFAPEPIAPEASDVSIVVVPTPPPSAEAPAASASNVVRATPVPADVALFLPAPRAKPGAKTLGELLDEALSL